MDQAAEEITTSAPAHLAPLYEAQRLEKRARVLIVIAWICLCPSPIFASVALYQILATDPCLPSLIGLGACLVLAVVPWLAAQIYAARAAQHRILAALDNRQD